MKITLKMLAAALVTATATSCSSFLDINDNPNSLTLSNPPTPALVLAQALNNTASNYGVSYNSYASYAVDYWGKSGIVSGYAEERTYNYSSNYYAGLFSGTYDNLNDYQYIQTQGTGGDYAYHAAIARIMKAYNYLLLVDQYGDIPYTQSLKGRDILTPTYDRAQDIYADLLVQLQGAIADINATAIRRANAIAAGNNTIVLVGSEDIVFGGVMANWKRFANSLQLRILMRESQTSNATLNATVATQLAALQTSSAADGFITTDVTVNPGYLQSAGQQNPFFTTYGLTSGGGSSGTRYYQLPTVFVLKQYADNKDPRISQLYTVSTSFGGGTGIVRATAYAGATTTGATITTATTGVYNGTNAGEANPPLVSNTSGNQGSFFRIGNISPTYGGLTGSGILKGLNAPTPLMLLSEHYFNKAEAETRGLFTGGDAAATTDYNAGVLASFLTYYRTAATPPFTNASAIAVGTPGYPQYTNYITAGASNPLVNFSAAATGANGKQAIIIFQKYLAENSLASIEALDDYRRTGLPRVDNSIQGNPSFAGQGVNGGKIPYRLLYPQSEINTNNNNLPKNVSQFSKIFWQN